MNSSGDLTDKPDIDVWFNPNYENYYKVLKVLRDLNYDTTFFEEEQAPDPQKSFFKIDFEDFTFDLLPSIKANIKFIEAYKRKVTVKTNDINIYVLSYTDLIKDKEANARPKDLEDIRQLKNLNKNQWIYLRTYVLSQ